jgi:NTP pyrophosphatase (non-canonical NTP hydrolase)
MVAWTPDAQARLFAMDESGLPIKEMAKQFNVSEKAIHVQRNRMGLTKRRPNSLKLLEQTVRLTGLNEDTGWVAHRNLTYCVTGLGSEAGELLSELKKVIRNDGGKLTSERRDKMLDEIGDILWYTMATILALRANVDDVIQNNHDKLTDRREAGEINERT